MTKSLIYTFDNQTSTGLDKVPNDGLILVLDFDGNGNSDSIIITSKVGITNTSTISDLITSGNYKFTRPGEFIVNMNHQHDTTDRFFGTTYADATVFSNILKKAGNKIKIHWVLPARNDINTNWGGLYINILYSVNNGGAWTSLGNSGYSGNIMEYLSGAIALNNGEALLNVTEITNATQIRFKFSLRSHSDTTEINRGHGARQAAGPIGMFFTNMTVIEIGR
ncbi:MAG: hypothetical protein KAI79_14200 [Bacteroidales bacterium]|nr:hypothetical protein [Bacteroidales bacterium]